MPIKPTTTSILTELGFSEKIIAAALEYATEAKLTLDPFLHGEVYSRDYKLPPYNEEELEKITTDIKDQIQVLTANVESQINPTYTATAGAPGTCHPQLLRMLFNFNDPAALPDNAVYLAPDDFAMPNMKFYQDILAISDHKAAYERTRDGSNAAVNIVHALAVALRLNVLHDTASVAPNIITIYKALNARGYNINLKLIFSNYTDRERILRFLEKHGRQLVPVTLALEKTSAVFDRMLDAYFDLPSNVAMFFTRNNGEPSNAVFKQFASYEKTGFSQGAYIIEGQSEFKQKLMEYIENDVPAANYAEKLKRAALINWVNTWREGLDLLWLSAPKPTLHPEFDLTPSLLDAMASYAAASRQKHSEQIEECKPNDAKYEAAASELRGMKI